MTEVSAQLPYSRHSVLAILGIKHIQVHTLLTHAHTHTHLSSSTQIREHSSCLCAAGGGRLPWKNILDLA